MNEKANLKICGATGFRLAVVFVTYMLFEEESSSRETRTKGWRRSETGGGGQRRTLAEYLTTLGASGRRKGAVWPAVEVPKVVARRKEAEKGPRTRLVARTTFFAFNLLRLAFYLGQTGIRLNALIKLLTSFGRPGGHRVSAGPRVGPFLSRRPFLPFIFVPSLWTANRNSYFDNRCFVRSATRDDQIVGQEFGKIESGIIQLTTALDLIATEFRCNYSARWDNGILVDN